MYGVGSSLRPVFSILLLMQSLEPVVDLSEGIIC
jgi:hypothetical protein